MQTIDKIDVIGTVQKIKEYSKKLGYELDNMECQNVIETGYQGEPLESAVEDWLNTWETCRHFGMEEDDE